MNRLPALKSFLKGDDGATLYDGVDVQFISGKKAVLTIFEDGVEVEQISLKEHSTSEEELHALMVSKGFKKNEKPEVKPEEEEEEEEYYDDDDDDDDIDDDDDDDFDDDDDDQVMEASSKVGDEL